MVRPFLANLHSSSSKKYSYTVCTGPNDPKNITFFASQNSQGIAQVVAISSDPIASRFFCIFCTYQFLPVLIWCSRREIVYCKRAILSLSSSKILTPHPPLRPASVYPPPLLGGRTHSPGGEGDGGSIFWKTSEIGLPSYSK